MLYTVILLKRALLTNLPWDARQGAVGVKLYGVGPIVLLNYEASSHELCFDKVTINKELAGLAKSSDNMKELTQNTYLFSSNAEFVEELYAEYLKKPDSVGEDWQAFFQQLQSQDAALDVDHYLLRKEMAASNRERRAGPLKPVTADQSKQVQVLQLINAYRFRGHQKANFDPLQINPREPVPELDLAYHDLSEADFATVFNTGSLSGPRQATLADIHQTLQRTYCGHIGIEYMHITDTDEKRWLQQRLEKTNGCPDFIEPHKLRILERTLAANEFEKYLHTRYVGQKRFSLEGAESLIPLLDELIERAGSEGVTEIVLGMAHRGRLNVLTNILGKAPRDLFNEFEGKANHNGSGSGDVKYHQGFSTDIRTSGGIVHLALAFNPSHLEIISPVVEGSARARQQRRNDKRGELVVPIIIHGDAAFAGQGVVMETFQMSEARGYTTGGTVHIIINNQIGFTTSNPLDARSTIYCTEVARMVQAPIFHVNGDDPEAVVFVSQVALDFRQKFNKDVVIDMVCYRRHGHSEADEPAATQPQMYTKIKAHALVSEVYAQRLIQQGITSEEQVREMVKHYRNRLDAGESVAVRIVTEHFEKPFWVDWTLYLNAKDEGPVATTVSRAQIEKLMLQLCEMPKNLALHPQVERILTQRKKMAHGEQGADWGFAETIAYATLVLAGFPVRLSGQDSGRGTFFHRHATIHDQRDGSCYTPLQQLSKDQAPFTVVDSILSEEAVLAYEYGYSTAAPYTLVIWEAQFGDFANGAQVVVDQFISSGQSKWGRLSGLVMLLPHGFDGQGPEHSSARLERYLQLCAENNMHVCVPTQPAQMFHLLRRQVLQNSRRPLVVMSPKSLLRHKLSTSELHEFSDSGFKTVIDEIDAIDAENVERVLLCSGKVYFDLLDARRERNISSIALIRVEELYPFPADELEVVLRRYQAAKQIVWCQEEPLNQGAWQFVSPLLANLLQRPLLQQEMVDKPLKLSVISRPASASPAVGYYQKHLEQLHALVNEALIIVG